MINTLMSTSYLGDIDLANLKEYYEGEMILENGIIAIDLNFEKTTIEKSKFAILDHVFSFTPSEIRQGMIDTLKSLPNHESIILYKEFIEEELESDYSSISDFLDSLQLKRIGFYPESKDSVAVFDFQAPDLEIDHFLCMHMDEKSRIIDISIES